MTDSSEFGTHTEYNWHWRCDLGVPHRKTGTTGEAGFVPVKWLNGPSLKPSGCLWYVYFAPIWFDAGADASKRRVRLWAAASCRMPPRPAKIDSPDCAYGQEGDLVSS